MSARRQYNTITPEALKDCIDRGLGVQGASLSLNVSKSNCRAACALFGWTPHTGNQYTPRPKPHAAHNPFNVATCQDQSPH